MPNWTYFAIHRDTEDRQFFRNWASLELFLSDDKFQADQWSYACWRHNAESIKIRTLKSFLNTPGCGLSGGHLHYELRKLRNKTVYLGIKNHHITECEHSFELPDFRCLRFDTSQYTNVVLFLRQYLQRRGLPEDSQIMIATDDESYEYQPSDLPNFCFLGLLY